MNELKDEVLEEVSGGARYGGTPIKLTGGYWSSCDGSGTMHTAAIGWTNLYIEYTNPGAKAPYRINDVVSIIGYTTDGHFSYK